MGGTHVSRWSTDDGDKLGALEDGDARRSARHYGQNLGCHSDGWHQDLNHQRKPWANLLDGPSGDEQVEGATEGRGHAEDGELGGGSGSNLAPIASIANPLIRRMSAVEVIALHEVDGIKDPAAAVSSVVVPPTGQPPDTAQRTVLE